MKITKPYQKRAIRFVEIFQNENWQIKIYSIAIKNEFVQNDNIEDAKVHLTDWLKKSELYNLETYNIATLIIHEGNEGCFAIINWWIGENMMQNFVYLKTENSDYKLFSQNGIITCVWELAVLWHERNAWLKHILQQHEKPEVQKYLNEQLNQDV